MAAPDKIETKGGPTAPYISFLTVKNVLKDMKQHGTPTRIDRSMFPNLAGGTVGQLLPALKFLKLMDDSGVPSDDLKKLIAALGTEDAWASELSKVVRASYAPLFKLNLEAASPAQFVELFRATYPGTEDVSRKSQTFFLNAAREAGIKISQFIMRNKKPRSGPTKKRAKSGTGNAADSSGGNGAGRQNDNDQSTQKLPSEILLGLLNPADMKKPEQDAIWTLIIHFKAKGQ